MLFFRYLITIILMATFTAHASLTMPAIFSDHMMLQANTSAAIWGTDLPDQTITVSASWGKTVSTTADKQGKWRVKLPTVMAGTNHNISISGSSKSTITDVALGEVWLCSGQSNMKFPMMGGPSQTVFGNQEAILQSTDNNMRLYTVARNTQLTPQDDVSGLWQTAEPSSVAEFSAVCYFFGKKLQQILQKPIGLILSAVGGTQVEAWTPKATLNKLNITDIPQTIPKKDAHRIPTVLFNGMINPIAGYSIKGVTWYQGEGNRENAKAYKDIFSEMITAWREHWQQLDLPFYFVQIAPYGNNKKDKNVALVRESQLAVMQTLDNTGMVVTMDIGNCNFIHPPTKKPVGDRLAYWALAKNYNIPAIAFSGPVYKDMKITGNKALLSFDYAETGLSTYGQALEGLEISGADQIFQPAQYKILKSGELQVWSEKVTAPQAVRYGFDNCIAGHLFNTLGLPASSFRTDNW